MPMLYGYVNTEHFPHFSGLNSYNYPDPHNVAVDYRGIGYRECASEVARYLVAVEGMDLQDPMRMRLLSHLQCFSAQREAAAKATIQNTSWSSMTTHAPINNQYGTGNSMQSMGSMISSQQNNQSDLTMSTHSSHQGIAAVSFSEARISQPESIHGNLRLASSMNMPLHGQISNMNPSAGQQVSPSLIPQLHGQFPVSLNTMQSMMSQNGSNNHYNNNSVKPYRPWGSELAYWTCIIFYIIIHRQISTSFVCFRDYSEYMHRNSNHSLDVLICQELCIFLCVKMWRLYDIIMCLLWSNSRCNRFFFNEN